MKRIRLIFFTLLIIAVAGCGKKDVLKEEQLNVSKDPHSGVSELITPLESTQLNIDGILVSVAAIDYGKKLKVIRENGWSSSDDRSVAESIVTSFGEGVAKGISGSEKESKDKDGELVLYLEMCLDEGERPKVAEVPIKITDDKDADFEVYSASYTHNPMSPDKKYLEVAKFKVYSDADYFLIKIGKDNVFKVEAPDFKWD